MISNFRLVLNVVFFILGNSPASEFYMPTFRNTLPHLHRQVGVKNELGLRNVGVFIWEKGKEETIQQQCLLHSSSSSTLHQNSLMESDMVVN